MYSLGKCVVVGSVFLLIAAASAEPLGFVEGQVKILLPKEVDIANGNESAITAEIYAQYPLIILSHGGKKEIARITADGNGNYRIALPPGDYVLDVQARMRGHVRAKPQAFTVAPNETVRVDMNIDTGVR